MDAADIFLIYTAPAIAAFAVAEREGASMRWIIGLPTVFCVVVICAAFRATPTLAQVINGEGTYEGSSLHQPPEPEPEAPRAKDGGKAPEAAATPRAGEPKRSD